MSKWAMPRVESSERQITVQTDYWSLQQDLQQGGAINSIIFQNGSGNNLLEKPIACYVDTTGDPLSFMSSGQKPPGEPGNALFSSIYECEPEVHLEISPQACPIITVRGQLKNQLGQTSDIYYQERSEYHAFYVRKTVCFEFPVKRSDIYALAVAKLVLSRSLNEYAFKGSAWQLRHGGNQLNAGRAVYGKTAVSVYPAYVERYPFCYLALFSRGQDAIEVLPSGSLQAWEEGISGSPGYGRFGLYTLDESQGSSVLLEPFRELTSGYPDPAYQRPELQGNYIFSYTIGLPRLEKNYPANIKHVGFNNQPWPDEKTISNWTEAGINLARLHNDFHASGNFWHDGNFPPYNHAGIQEMQTVLKRLDAAGIKVIPYFSLVELHPQAEAWQKHHNDWKRSCDGQNTEMHNFWQNGEYGSQMCLASGWGDYLKSYIQKIITTYGFDGMYFDWCSPLYCNNRRHCEHDHISSDQVLEFMEWSRDFLGPEGPLLIHSSASPFMAAESYADATIVFEEIYAPPALLSEPPLVDYFQPQLDMANCLQRLLCPSILAFKGLDSARKFVANGMAAGLLSYMGATSDPEHPISQSFRRLKDIRLDDYILLPSGRSPIRTESDDLRAAIFYNNREMLLIAVNVNKPGQLQGRLFLELEQLPAPWREAANFRLQDEQGNTLSMSSSELEQQGLLLNLDAYEYQIWQLQPAS